MALPSVLQAIPFVTAGVWLGLVPYLVARDRFHTWTEVFLLATCFFLGAYALSDAAFLNATTSAAAETAAKASLTAVSLVVASFLLFAAVLHGRVRRGLFLLFAPTTGAVVLVWTRIVAATTSAADVGLPYRIEFDAPWFDLWLAYALVYSLAGFGYFALTFAELRRQEPAVARRMGLLLSALLLAFLLGAGTNLLVALRGAHEAPLFSSLLVVPGLLAFVALTPSGERLVVQGLHRLKARDYEVEAAFATYSDGTLLGARTRAGELGVDEALFSATLDVIQNFLRTSFPLLGNRFLTSITQGDRTLVIERGKIMYLTVILRGRENDQLRRLMRDAVRAYEHANAATFSHWRGEPALAIGTESMLALFLEG